MSITRAEFVRQLDRSGLLSLGELASFEKDLSSDKRLETVEELVNDQINHPVVRSEEGIDVVMGFDGQSGQVDRRDLQRNGKFQDQPKAVGGDAGR